MFEYPKFGVVDELDRAFDHIARSIRARRADFLFGAGMSAAGKLPVGTRLAEQLLRFFFPDTAAEPIPEVRLHELAAKTPFESLVQAVELVLGGQRSELTKILKEKLAYPERDLPEAHKRLAQMCFPNGSRPSVNRLFTTNFDDLLDRTLGKSGERITEKTTGEIPEAQRKGRIPILYLHGVLNEEYQITEKDVFDDSFKALHANFHAALNEADAFVFVGYSMSDPDFRRIYLRFREGIELRRNYSDRYTYVVSPADDEFQYRLGRKVWECRKAIWIPFDAETFFGRLNFVLKTQTDKEMREFIKHKYGLHTDEEYQDKVKHAAELLRVEEADAVQYLADAATKTGKSS